MRCVISITIMGGRGSMIILVCPSTGDQRKRSLPVRDGSSGVLGGGNATAFEQNDRYFPGNIFECDFIRKYLHFDKPFIGI